MRLQTAAPASAGEASPPRFVRRTTLADNEYRKNFRQLDRDVLAAVTSREADAVTPLMSKIYLRLVNAPDRYWEREGVLRFEAEVRGEKLVKAWAVFCEVAGVASATASKALRWMHEQGIIGYAAGKNGVGLRVFLNRAASSIGVRRTAGAQKILAFSPASSAASRASANEAAFNDSFADRESLDPDVDPRAPKNGAEPTPAANTTPSPIRYAPTPQRPATRSQALTPQTRDAISLDELVTRLSAELEPAVRVAAQGAAAREHERTREWLETRGLPKAARVAQHEAYNVLRRYGLIGEAGRAPSRASAGVGRNDYVAPEPRPLAHEEIAELAGICVAMLESKGQSIDQTLSEMSAEAGGLLLPCDAPRVREKANSLLESARGGGGK